MSTDAGVTWRGSAPEQRHSLLHLPLFTPRARGALAYTIPYLQANWERFLASHRGRSMQPAVLCKSRHGRDVECLYFGWTGRPAESWSRSRPLGWSSRAATMPVRPGQLRWKG